MTIPKNAFRFCKITITLLVWLSFAFRNEATLIAVFLLLFSSALLKINRAPLIVFYSKVIEPFYKSEPAEVSVEGMRFAHSMGSALALISVILTLAAPSFGWWFVLGFAILKSLSMLGFCPGEAVYSCYHAGTCKIIKK